MSKAVISGTYADLKTIRTRKCIQVVVEVPIEKGPEVVAAFGFPQPESEVWLAVARLDPDAVKTHQRTPEKPRERFHDKPYSVQAGIRCGDPRFQRFIAEQYNWDMNDAEGAANFVRTHCGVASRKGLDIEDFEVARQNWKHLNAEFEQWAGLMPEAR